MKRFVIPALILLMIGGAFTFFIYLKINGDPTEHKRLMGEVSHYLSERGYVIDEDVESMEVRYLSMKRPNYYVAVVFKDEPDTVYLYCERLDVLEQCDIEGYRQNAKHRE